MKNIQIVTLLLSVFSIGSSIDTIAGQISFRLLNNRIDALASSNYIPPISIINTGVPLTKSQLKISVYDDMKEINVYIANDIDIYPGNNLIQNIHWKSVKNIFTDFVLPGIYHCEIELINTNGEFNVNESSILEFSVDQSSLIPLSPISESTVNLPVQFCYVSQTVLSLGRVHLSIWKRDQFIDETNIRSFELPPLLTYDFSTPCALLPLDLPQLTAGDEYYWVLEIRHSGKLIASTPISKFKVDNPQEKEERKFDYRLIEPRINDGSYIFGSTLRFGYKNKFNEKNLNYQIIDLSTGKRVKTRFEIPLQDGLNYLDIDLNGVPGLIYNRTYMMEIRDRTNIKYSVVFSLDSSGKRK